MADREMQAALLSLIEQYGAENLSRALAAQQAEKDKARYAAPQGASPIAQGAAGSVQPIVSGYQGESESVSMKYKGMGPPGGAMPFPGMPGGTPTLPGVSPGQLPAPNMGMIPGMGPPPGGAAGGDVQGRLGAVLAGDPDLAALYSNLISQNPQLESQVMAMMGQAGMGQQTPMMQGNAMGGMMGVGGLVQSGVAPQPYGRQMAAPFDPTMAAMAGGY